MEATVRQPTTVDDIIAALESAPQGSRTFDVQLAYCLGDRSGPAEGVPTNARLPAKWHALGDFPAIAKIMLDEGFSWQSVCDVLDCEAPAYTTSLDAGIPGENIVFVIRSTKRNQWGAIHKSADGEEIFGWGATEALARRTAALKAWKEIDRADQENRTPAAEQEEHRTQETRTDPAPAGTETGKPVVKDGDNEMPLERSLEQAMAEREEADWEILF